MSMRSLCLFLVLGLTVLSVNAQTPAAEPPAPPAISTPAAAADEIVGPIKLPDADIDTVLGLLEIYTGRSILRPQQLPTATYRLVIDRKIPKSEAVLALETVLALNQVGVAPMGDKFLKVVALSQVKTEAPEMIMGSTLDMPASGRVATKLFQLNFLRVNEFIPQIMPILSPGIANGVVPLDKANAALITDSVSNLQRVEQLIEQLDAPTMAGLTPKFYALHNAKASDLVGKIRGMFQGPLQGQLGSSVSYSADDRTNQIILLADARQIPLFDQLIAKMDVIAEPNTRQEVIPLKHASAKDVSTLLSQLVSGQTAATQKASGGNSVHNPAPGQPAPPLPVTPDAASLGLADSTNEFSSLITILADERSNAVVVSGTVDDIRLIRGLVEKLDIVLAQVRIEIVIAEVTLSDEATSGISQLGLQVTNGRLTGIDGGTTGTTLTGIGTSSFATLNPRFFLHGGELNLTGLVSLTTTPRKGKNSVLSVPTITTTHNKEAKIFVGATRPTISSNTSTVAGSQQVSPGYNTSSVTQQEVGITITVKPLIGNDGSVQLDLKQEISDVGALVVLGPGFSQNEINKRSTQSFITAKSGEILVLGGLQKKTNSRSTSRLGPIPIIGDLLGSRNRSETRTDCPNQHPG
jgi:general secretion pathway protein D